MRPAALAALVSSGVPLEPAMSELGLESISDDLIILAIEVGAPLVPTLKILEQQLTHSERAEAEIHQAQAVPQATRKLLLWLPAGTVLISQVLGLNTLHGFTEPLGLAALLAAGGLLYAGARITSGMLKRFEVAPESEVKELIALKICLGAGMGLGEIRRRLGNLGPETTALIELSERSGAALGSLIQSEIEVLNEKAISDQLTRAKKLSVSLLIPLSATTLPAFLLLTIVPMVIGIAK